MAHVTPGSEEPIECRLISGRQVKIEDVGRERLFAAAAELDADADEHDVPKQAVAAGLAPNDLPVLLPGAEG